ncbi:4-hydroxybenzoyl-CoA reductase subunit beta [Aromatoleum petrolei]|uniref:4-hydroxybenzoyl-CoA reductase subunit beta n=2 Tax=Aromatoleum petrolei TaxID=76116 RepID=A0ABX1MQV2_9RHOO|nr:4-hydroxybenzoyl-CoA reductase subunit beta [Aromatoleum petrolei]NMF90305.1 4-hydroxybenzoyl-CoA reductase subunit beta [Aromatoleum petrolei]QTQ37093.1 4-hydroxybenzoyl-CoA reductase, beta subunit [Aromatoleum petrolei]
MGALSEFRLMRAASTADAVRLRGEFPASRFIAGGTDLLPNMRRGLVGAEVLIDLGGVDEIRELRSDGDRLRIGAGVTLATLAADPTVVSGLPALAQAALAVAGPTHRSAATLGGNLCLDTRCQYYNQSQDWRRGNDFCMKRSGDVCRVAPKSSRCYAAFSGDVAPALLALGAEVELLGAQGLRRLPLAEFYIDDGMNWLALGPDELLVAVTVPLVAGRASAYEKIRVRGAIDFPLAGVAVALRRDGELIGELRVACTGVSSRPEFIAGLDELVGKPLDDAALATMERHLKRGIQPMETTLVSVPYRRRATPLLAKRLVRRLWDEARQGA